MGETPVIVQGLERSTMGWGGFSRIVENPKWALATIGYSEKYAESHFSTIARHLFTDETFVLLQGEATLVIGKELLRVKMMPCVCYTVKAGTWHHVLVSRDARIIVVENSDTSRENTETISIK